MSKLSLLSFLMLVGFLEFAAPTPSRAADAVTTIGVILPFTGPFAKYGERIRAAVQALNQPGVKFIFEDEGCDPLKAVTASASFNVSGRPLNSNARSKFFWVSEAGSSDSVTPISLDILRRNS